MSDELKNKPLPALCGTCSHTWPVAHLPMALDRLEKILREAHCPSCGEEEDFYVKECEEIDKITVKCAWDEKLPKHKNEAWQIFSSKWRKTSKEIIKTLHRVWVATPEEARVVWQRREKEDGVD